MKDISILIPTCKRPHFLGTALESVARQTAADRIGEVLVIENGGDRRSEEVCRKFPNLPIKYIFRNPMVPLSKLTVAVLSEPSLPIVALLHDDDWWLDAHLQRSVDKLDQQPSLSAVYSCNFVAESEVAWLRGINGNFTAWFGNDQRIGSDTRILNFSQVLITSILQAGFHMSSLVFRRSVIEACFAAFDDGNEFDNDRTLAVELSRQGDILFHDTPSVITRTHANQDGRLAKQDTRGATWFPRNTQRMINQAIHSSIDIPAELTKRISRPGFDAKRLMKCVPARDLDILAANALLPQPLLREYKFARWRDLVLRMIFRLKDCLQSLCTSGK